MTVKNVSINSHTLRLDVSTGTKYIGPNFNNRRVEPFLKLPATHPPLLHTKSQEGTHHIVNTLRVSATLSRRKAPTRQDLFLLAK